MKKKQQGFAIVAGFILLIVVAAVGFGGWKVYDNNNKDNSVSIVPSQPDKYVKGVAPTGPEITVTGTNTCLMHKDATGPQTEECAIGIKTDDGKYYGLIDKTEDYSLISEMNGRVKVSGILTTDQYADSEQKYSSDGSIYITAVEKL